MHHPKSFLERNLEFIEAEKVRLQEDIWQLRSQIEDKQSEIAKLESLLSEFAEAIDLLSYAMNEEPQLGTEE